MWIVRERSDMALLADSMQRAVTRGHCDSDEVEPVLMSPALTKRKGGVNTMMDPSSVIDASLVFAWGLAVVLMGAAKLPSESSTVSTSQSEHTEPWDLQEAA